MISRFLTGVFIESKGGGGLLVEGSEMSCKPAKDSEVGTSESEPPSYWWGPV